IAVSDDLITEGCVRLAGADPDGRPDVPAHSGSRHSLRGIEGVRAEAQTRAHELRTSRYRVEATDRPLDRPVERAQPRRAPPADPGGVDGRRLPDHGQP